MNVGPRPGARSLNRIGPSRQLLAQSVGCCRAAACRLLGDERTKHEGAIEAASPTQAAEATLYLLLIFFL
jgi:hypothetical protein